MIKIDFEFDAPPYGTFRDALLLSEDHGLTDVEIDALKQERFDNWMTIVNPPPSDEPAADETPPPPPTAINIAGVDYELLDDIPAAGMVLIEVNSRWYYKV